MDLPTLLIIMIVLGVGMTAVIVWASVRLLRQAREGKPLTAPPPVVGTATSAAAATAPMDQTYSPEAFGPVAPAKKPAKLQDLPVDEQVVRMRKAIRSWAWFQLFFGALALVLGQTLSAPWGIVQITIGLASFYFYSDYAMFMVYAGAFAWAALNNVMIGISSGASSILIGGGLLQVFWAFQNYQLYQTYQKATRVTYSAAAAADTAQPADVPPPLWEPPSTQIEDTRAQKSFAWLSLFMGLGGLTLAGVIFIGLITFELLKVIQHAPPGTGFVIEVSILFGIMGVPVALASLRGGYKPKAASIIGLVSGLIMIAVYVWLLVRGTSS